MVRNSTDTAYFQRLRPYPRILLRRLAARFKDYDKSPIGFGIVVFCIVKDNCKCVLPATHACLCIRTCRSDLLKFAWRSSEAKANHTCGEQCFPVKAWLLGNACSMICYAYQSRGFKFSHFIPCGVEEYVLCGKVHHAKGSRNLVRAVPVEMANRCMQKLGHDTQVPACSCCG